MLLRLIPIAGLIVFAAVLAAAGRSSEAAFPGKNGLIVFTSKRDGDPEIFTVRADGRGLRRLTRNRVHDYCPAWSRDGRRLAFTRTRRMGSDLFVMRADGSGLHRVLRSPGWDACPAWSPDGRRLAFHRLVMAVDPEKRVQDIYTVRLDGRDLRRLTVEGSSYKPSWSTGDRIAWHFRQNTLYFNDIFTMKPDGSDRVRLTDNSNNDDPSWSPDGRRVVFSGEDDGDIMDRELFIVEADGSTRVQVTDDEPWDIDPVWSPDGRWILYPSFATKSKNFDLYVIRPDGSGRRRLLSARGADFEPDWAPAR